MSKLKKNIAKIIFGIFVISFITLFFVFRLDKYFSLQNINEVRELILKFSILGPLIVVLLFMIFNLACLPTLYFNFLSGYLYGPLFGSLTALIGMILGLMTSFLNVRWLFREDFVEKFGSNKTVTQIDKYTEKYGSQLVVIMRLLFIIPYNIQNVAYGLSSIQPLRYLTFSAIGIVPLTLAYVWIGHLINLQVMGTADFKKYSLIIGILIAFFAIVIIMSILIGKKMKNLKA